MKEAPKWPPKLPVHFLLLILFLLLLPSFPSFSSHFGYRHLCGPNCSSSCFCHPPEDTGPLHDNHQLESQQHFGTMGQIIYPWTKPKETDSFAPGGLEELPPSEIMLQLKAQKRKQAPCMNNKANSWEAEPEWGPFKHFSLGTWNRNKALPCFHVSNHRLYRILSVSSK